MKYIIQETFKSTGRTYYVAARPGWCRKADGSFERDGSLLGGPEITLRRAHALEFSSHRAAARVASKLVYPVIREVN